MLTTLWCLWYFEGQWLTWPWTLKVYDLFCAVPPMQWCWEVGTLALPCSAIEVKAQKKEGTERGLTTRHSTPGKPWKFSNFSWLWHRPSKGLEKIQTLPISGQKSHKTAIVIKKTRRRIDIYRIVKTSQNGFVDTVLSLEYAAHLPRISDLFCAVSCSYHPIFVLNHKIQKAIVLKFFAIPSKIWAQLIL